LNSSSSNTSLVNQPQQQPQQQHQQQTQHQMNQPQLQMQLQQQQKQMLQPSENLIQQIQVIDFGMLSNQNNNSNQLNSNGLIKLNSFKIRDQLLITDQQQQQQQQQQLQQQHQLQKAIGNQRPENTINSILNSLKPPPQSQPQPQPSITNQQEAPKATNNKKTSAHPYLKSFACSTCSRTFFYENHLRKHILSKHTVHPQFSCSFCHKGMQNKFI
jgi:hypothetical protein